LKLIVYKFKVLDSEIDEQMTDYTLYQWKL